MKWLKIGGHDPDQPTAYLNMERALYVEPVDETGLGAGKWVVEFGNGDRYVLSAAEAMPLINTWLDPIADRLIDESATGFAYAKLIETATALLHALDKDGGRLSSALAQARNDVNRVLNGDLG